MISYIIQAPFFNQNSVQVSKKENDKNQWFAKRQNQAKVFFVKAKKNFLQKKRRSGGL